MDGTDAIGQACALGSAMTWAVSVMLFKKSEEISPLGLNLFKNVVALALLAPTMLFLGLGFDLDRALDDWLRLIVSGLLGIADDDNLLFAALRRLGASVQAIVHCSYAPIFVVLSVLVLGERPGLSFLGGAVLVVGGILWVTTERAPALRAVAGQISRVGIVFGLLDVTAMGIGVVIAKPVLERGDLVEVTTVRLMAGIAGQLLWMLAVPSQRAALGVFRPQRVWRTLLPASILGSYVSMLLWLAGFKWTSASVAAVLNQMTTVFIIALSRVVLGEVVTARRATGAAIALAGTILIVVL